jgi:biopolymer transport protein ExbD
MPLKTEGIDEPELNLTPMIDIVFLLIIFFMVGTRFARDEPTMFDIELAASRTQAAALTPGPDPVLIAVMEDGSIRVNRQAVSLEELERLLREKKANFAEQAVVIGGESEADLQRVVDIFDICKRVGIRRFTLAARPVGSSR